jgi:uncharacterized integral membrane protein
MLLLLLLLLLLFCLLWEIGSEVQLLLRTWHSSAPGSITDLAAARF